MNLFALSALLTGISSLSFGIFVFIKNRKNKVNQLWAIFATAVAIWGFGGYKVALTTDLSNALFQWQITHIGIILIPALFLHFVYVFLEIKKRKWLLYLIYLFAFLFLILEWTDLFLSESNMTSVFPPFYWVYPPTPLYSFFVFSWFIIIFCSHYVLYRALRKSFGLKRTQIKYFFLATAIGFSGGSISFLPVFGINVYPIFNFSVPLYPIIMSYAILRYRLMDIRVAIGRGAVYLFSFATVIGLALGMMFLNSRLVRPVPLNISYGLVLVISIFIFQFIFRFYEKIASRYFYYTFYSSHKVITELSEKLDEVLDISKLTSLISDTLINTMKLDRAGVLLRDSDNGQYRIQKIIGFKEENGISLVKDNFLTLYLEKTKKPLVYEELGLAIRDAKTSNEKEKLTNLQENMKRIEAKICLPLFRERKITGMIVLGTKISGDSYSEQDLDLLVNLSTQASIALENARLYAQVQDLSHNLQQKVDEQTKEIREAYQKVEKAYVIEKKAHQEIKEAYEKEKKVIEAQMKVLKAQKKVHKEFKHLDEAKDQFMLATQHHLRTPLTSMYGYLVLLLEGGYGRMPKRIREVIEKFELSTKNEMKIVDELLDVSQYQLGKKIVVLIPDTELEPILNDIIEDLKPETEKKNIYLKLDKTEPMPKLSLDPTKFKVALTNLIDNSVKYTLKGGVTIKIHNLKSKIQIIIQDTGIGISKEEAKLLFTRLFERGKTAKKLFATGKGIGLFIASRIIQEHKGKVWAESKGKDKGSVFYIELPVK